MAYQRDIPSKDSWLEELIGVPESNQSQLTVVRRALRDVLANELSERQRQLILMRYYEDKRPAQIARELGICPSTVSRTLRRAKKRIYDRMRFYFDYRSIHFEE